MSGYNTVLKIRLIEEQVSKLGFQLAHAQHNYQNEFGDVVALVPKDIDSVPIYSRDAEIFVGSLEQLQMWLRGVEWARSYDRMLGVSDVKKRERKEQDERNKQLAKILKEEPLSLVKR